MNTEKILNYLRRRNAGDEEVAAADVIERQAAQIEMMREALIACRDDLKLRMTLSKDDSLNISNYVLDKMLDAIDTTPDQALDQFAAKVREQCAKACDAQADHPECPERAVYCAEAIRAIKELP